MLADKSKFRILMVEGDGRRPRFCSVARLALLTYGTIMTIRVAGNALRTEPLVRLVRMDGQNLLNIGVYDILRRVTLFARQRLMRSCEDKSGLPVVKTLLIEFRDLCILAKMFHVT